MYMASLYWLGLCRKSSDFFLFAWDQYTYSTLSKTRWRPGWQEH